MITTSRAYLVGGGVGSLAAAAFLIRDGGVPGSCISILESGPGTSDLFKPIPSLTPPGQRVVDDTLAFNAERRRASVPVDGMDFSRQDQLAFSCIETLDDAQHSVGNPRDALVLPLQRWLVGQGVRLVSDCTVIGLDHTTEGGQLVVTSLQSVVLGQRQTTPLNDGDLVFVQNSAATAAPPRPGLAHHAAWALRETPAVGPPCVDHPAVFSRSMAQPYWASFTVTLKDAALVALMQRFSGHDADPGGLVTFKESAWMMSIVLAQPPQFVNEPAGLQVFWGYGLFPDRIGDFVGKSMADCTGEEILRELCGHLHMDLDTLTSANCIPCCMPYITSLFVPRAPGDEPLAVPTQTQNFAFVSQLVEAPLDAVFTVEYAVRAAHRAAYEPSFHARFEPLRQALR